MKITDTKNKIERSQDFPESKYTIKASPKAFLILSDALYSNKIQAVIRELSTNAYDSHVENGNKEQPFDVHIPSRMEPMFFVRDYGTGMSHEDCMHLYTTYFGSTRTDSNEAVGCMGLGSKSPFAYTDSFTVESFYNGEHRTYNAYKNEKHEPVFALLNELPTDEPNGLKVSFAVEVDSYGSDPSDFGREARKIYRHFDVRPNITGAELGMEDKKIILEGEFWRIVGGGSEAVAVMGNVGYPISSKDCSAHKKITRLLGDSIEINFDIGELDITPSRESLSYNDLTKQSIITKCETIIKEFEDIVRENFAKCGSMWEARKLFSKMVTGHSCVGHSVGMDTIKYKGREIYSSPTRHVDVNDFCKENDITIRHYSKNRYNNSGSVEMSEGNYMAVDNRFVYVFDDLKRGGIGRTKDFACSHCSDAGGKVYLIRGSKESLVLFKEHFEMPDSDIVYTSSLEKSSPVGLGGRSKTRSKVSRLKDCNRVEDARLCWEDVDVDIESGGVYVPINRYYAQGSVERTPSEVSYIVRHLRNLGVEIDDVFGVKTSMTKTKKFAKNKGKWTNLFDLAKEVLTEMANEPSMRYKIGTKRFFHTNEEWVGLVGQQCVNTESDLIMSLNRIVEMTTCQDALNIINLARAVGFSLDFAKGVDWPSFTQRVEDKYPMLSTLNDSLSSSQTEVVENYVKLIDREEA
tara:strand:+ start:6244 stop:8313 length:2070 start_codon:yes stop_codon:yes gene_type:complete